jgi:hypothetical protein
MTAMPGRVKPVVVAISLALFGGCVAPTPHGPPPNGAEAEAFLDRIVGTAQGGDFAELCAMGGGNCERILERAGRDVPEAPPRIVGSRLLTATDRTLGGVVLELCGVHDSGETYYTEVLVERANGELLAIEPIYWSGFAIAGDNTVGDNPQNAGDQCS